MDSSSKRRFHPIDLNKIKKDGVHQILNDCSIQPYFENIESHLTSHIEKASYVIGCVAWLSNRDIIQTLSEKKGVKIIVNKEEYLNSNMTLGQRFCYQCLRGKYNDVTDLLKVDCECCQKNVKECQNFIKIFDKLCDDSSERDHAILTCGIVNNFSKMHHKFLIFLNDRFEPYGVWTGSYNLSYTSNFSLENALYITEQSVINEYLKEFIAIYPFSEHHDWNSGILFGDDNR